MLGMAVGAQLRAGLCVFALASLSNRDHVDASLLPEPFRAKLPPGTSSKSIRGRPGVSAWNLTNDFISNYAYDRTLNYHIFSKLAVNPCSDR